MPKRNNPEPAPAPAPSPYPVAGEPPNYPGAGVLAARAAPLCAVNADGVRMLAATVACFDFRNDMIEGSLVVFDVPETIRAFEVPEGYGYSLGASYARLDVPAIGESFLVILPDPVIEHEEGSTGWVSEVDPDVPVSDEDHQIVP